MLFFCNVIYDLYYGAYTWGEQYSTIVTNLIEFAAHFKGKYLKVNAFHFKVLLHQDYQNYVFVVKCLSKVFQVP